MLRPLLLLTILCCLASLSLAQETPPLIDLGAYVGEISAENPSMRYRFNAQAGETYLIQMETSSGDLDPYLFLFDSTEQLIADNDDSGVAGSRNAQIEFTPSSNDTFIIEASRYLQEAGTSIGQYRLALSLKNNPVANDPLSTRPTFTVPFSEMRYFVRTTGDLNENQTRQYFVLGGRQGEFLQMNLSATSGDISPSVRLLNEDFVVISRITQDSLTAQTLYAVIPQTGWYLVEVERRSGTGAFSLEARRLSNTILSEATPITAFFTEERQTLRYVFNARINERAFVNLTLLEGDNITPQMTILDLSQTVLDQRQSAGSQVRSVLNIPRSGAYIVEVSNLGTGTSGSVRLQIRQTAADISKLTVQTAQYNEDYTGAINNDKAIDYYRINGKRGELITLEMQGLDSSLDPYLILLDSDLNEVTFNDNTGASPSARIAQYELQKDGDFYILATRPNLERGTSIGDYRLSITVGQLALQTGNLTATLRWQGDSDLNLFVIAPNSETISWANPQAEKGILQIDSNTDCVTPSAQAVEHIYFPESLSNGDYLVWVWYQRPCSNADPITFSLEILVNGVALASMSQETLAVNERFEVSFRVEGERTLPIDLGLISKPTPQQTASQGGDTLIVYGQTLLGTISPEVYAEFYQFSGQAGDTIRIQVERTTGNLDPIIVLRDKFNQNLATNDDASEATRNAELVYTLERDERYIIAVTRFGARAGSTTGDYRLSLGLQP